MTREVHHARILGAQHRDQVCAPLHATVRREQRIQHQGRRRRPRAFGNRQIDGRVRGEPVVAERRIGRAFIASHHGHVHAVADQQVAQHAMLMHRLVGNGLLLGRWRRGLEAVGCARLAVVAEPDRLHHQDMRCGKPVLRGSHRGGSITVDAASRKAERAALRFPACRASHRRYSPSAAPFARCSPDRSGCCTQRASPQVP